MSEATRARWRRAAALAGRLILGAVFVYAAATKIKDPPGFAHEIYNYRLLPGTAINLLALWLPWIEIVIGTALILGLWRRASAGVLGLLLIVFIGALSWNLARGRPVECGCFGGSAVVRTERELLADMRLAIARDVVLLGLAAYLLIARTPGRDPARLEEVRRTEPAS